MDSKKEKLLKKAYDEYIDLMLYDFPIEKISEIAVNDVTGYGTTLDEKVLEIKRLKKIVTDQREQGAGLDMQFSITPVHRRISPDEDTAIYMDEFEISMVVDEAKNVVQVRLTSVFEFSNNTWKLVHLHGSKAVETEEDTWHLNEWKQKSEQLQKLVEEKTAELLKQNRELEIEAALERVRNRSLAMHNSNELVEVVRLLDKEITGLGVEVNGSQILTDFADPEKGINDWYAREGQDYLEKFHVPYLEHPLSKRVYNALHKGVDFYTENYSKAEKNKYFRLLFKYSDFGKISKERKEFIFHSLAWIRAVVVSKNSILVFQRFDLKKFTKEEEGIFKRFGKVFEQSFIRFLDLQKAEAQAREAQIETALERVRSRTMGMQKSEELAEVIAQINAEITNLGIQSDNTGLITDIKLDEKLGSFCMWFSIPGKTYSNKFKLPVMQHPIVDRMIEAWKKKKEFYTESLSKKEKNEYFKIVFQESDLKLLPDERKEILLNAPGWSRSVVLQKNSGLALQRFRDEPFSDQENAVASRFGRVFEQTYTRFLDLQKAEQQLREAVKQASLDRVRGEIASMRTKDDLDQITPLIWKELIALGVPFIRCGVFIMDDVKRVVHSYLSTPDGKSLSAFEMSFDDEGIAKAIAEYWKKEKIYKEFWDKNQFLDFMNTLIDQGKVDKPESYQGSAPPPESLYLNFVPFKQGMLYVGNTSALEQEELELVMSLADSFSIAYARYEDFKQLEEAKTKTEVTLKDLKSTQSQLIQSEKMASLGELTAGIAHEIQNPLNFVNNFSEVNRELIQELKEAVASNDQEEIQEILKDLAENEDKVKHHGQRAEAIVKGMLQHSRTSQGEKEPTDINALADEYLRLAYHGLRAKDKSFNADFKTDFDSTLPKINVIPQDIGRVLLNLINNAFYAVDEKSKKGIDGYKPEVLVSTGKHQNSIEISVKDNGKGIPEQVRDKIFQPFFTTKPTGQGTGLGLSLSYDITKAHNGEIKVSNENVDGIEFTIILPYR